MDRPGSGQRRRPRQRPKVPKLDRTRPGVAFKPVFGGAHLEIAAPLASAAFKRDSYGIEVGGPRRWRSPTVRSPRDVLFSPDGLGLVPRVFTPTTAKLPKDQQIPSVSTKTHLPYFDEHPFIPRLILYQQIAKLRSTYVGEPAWTEEIETPVYEPRTKVQIATTMRLVTHAPTGFWKYLDGLGYIHPSFMLHRTVTGRTASADPNGQNFPKRGPLAKAYRKIFVARPGYTFIECDLSQAELRIAAWMSGDPVMLDIYRSGGDIHIATALIVSNLSESAFAALPDHLKKEYRQKAKSVCCQRYSHNVL